MQIVGKKVICLEDWSNCMYVHIYNYSFPKKDQILTVRAVRMSWFDPKIGWDLSYLFKEIVNAPRQLIAENKLVIEECAWHYLSFKPLDEIEEENVLTKELQCVI